MPARRVAEGLGITAESLRTWRRRLPGLGTVAANDALGKLPTATTDAEVLRVEVRRLRAQLQSVTIQRDILQKAVGIFATPTVVASTPARRTASISTPGT